MLLLRAVVGGVVGGLVGGAVWAALVYLTDYEIGYVAWGVGLLVGLGVRLGADDLEGFVPGVLAASLAILAVCGGKYAVASIRAGEVTAKISTMVTEDGLRAADAAAEMARRPAGAPAAWRNGKTADTAESLGDYPKDVEAKVTAAWAKMTPAERESRLTERRRVAEAGTQAFRGKFRDALFMNSFGAFDIVFFILATLTAFKLGSNLSSDS